MIKLLMSWDIIEGKESEYSDFIVHDFIPRCKRLGLMGMQFWYTSFGECEQIQASGKAPTIDQMRTILSSEEWANLVSQLDDYVTEFNMKVIQAADGFQL